MTIATGIAKKVTYKKETTWGTAATGGAATGQSLRRVTSNLDLSKATYESKEIRPDYQIADFRHGVRTVGGTLNGELSAGSYADFMASICRSSWATAIAPAAYATTVLTSAAVGDGSTGTITRSSGSFITDGFKVGDVVRQAGWTTTGVPFNGRNFWITTLTSTVMTGQFVDGTLVPSKAAESGGVTIFQAGRKVSMATTGQVNDSYTIEHFFSDISQSEVFVGCRVSDMDIKLPATGMATIDISFMGKDMTTAGTAYFTSPTAATGTGVLAAVNGALYLNGAAVALITGMNMKITGSLSTGEVVGSNTTPDVFVGAMRASGQLTAYFTSNTMRDLFINETEVGVAAVFTAANTANADFIGLTMSRIKLGGAGKDDGEKGLSLTMPYTALLNVGGGSGTATTLSTLTIQDSAA